MTGLSDTHETTPGLKMSNRAWVTLATNDSYGLGALVLAHSLRRAGSVYPAVVLITPSVTDAMRERLQAVFANVVTVDVLDSRDAAHLALLQRPELGITFTKIHCWELTQYEKCVFLDADTLVVQNCDELFEREELSAAPDVGWPDCFNSGVFVYKPSQATFDELIKFAQERGSFDGGDQGLLNSFFSDWAQGNIEKHLPFLYNVTSAAFYSYLPALKHYGQNLKIIHFIGAAKPWLQQYNWESRSVDAPEHLREFLQLWWDLFVGQVHPQLDTNMVEVQEAPPELPPQDVSQHYMPTVDPESEFPWHHPDAQVQEDSNRHAIDLSQFHDPWEIYGGHIPPRKNETQTHEPLTGKVEDYEEMKKYVWEYQPPHQDHVSYASTSMSYQDHSQVHHHSHTNYGYQESYSNTHQIEQHWDTFSHHSPSQSEHDPNPIYYKPQKDNSQWQPYSSHDHHHRYENNTLHYQPNQSQFLENLEESNEHQHYCTHNLQHSDTHHQHIPQHEASYNNHQNTSLTTSTSHITSDAISSHPQQTSKEKHVHYFHHQHDEHSPSSQIHQDSNECKNELTNGEITDSDSEYVEDSPKRHPYDGFYLRHRSVIDSYGRKMCTHEIPPTPTPSPPTVYEPTHDPVHTLLDAVPLINGFHEEHEEHSGVAGNLARVVPGAAGSQREALDELTRRQGWEAGNIDYMGADSFANIWARISQTLSQPRTSPPKQIQTPPKQPSPTKQPSPPKEQPVSVESVKEVSVVDASASQTAAEAAAPVQIPVSVEPPKPVEAPTKSVSAPVADPVDEKPPVQTSEQVTKAAVEVPVPVVLDAPVPVATKASTPVTEETPVSVVEKAQKDISPAPVTVLKVAATETKAPANVPKSEVPASVVAASTPAPAPPNKPESPKSSSPGEISTTKTTVETLKKPSEKTELPVLPTPPASPSPSTPATKSSPAAAAVATTKKPVVPEVTPKKVPASPSASTDSPPLANTPSKDGAPAMPDAKLEERRKGAGKLELKPPVAADPLPTPDSELEDAASLATSIIAGELRTPTVSSPSSAGAPATPPAPAQPHRLSVDDPEIPTPPVESTAVSLAQIGVKPKAKTTIASQIESSVAEKSPEASPSTADPPKKKIVKKVVKKEGTSTGDAPVPPPRKKEKKPKEK